MLVIADQVEPPDGGDLTAAAEQTFRLRATKGHPPSQRLQRTGPSRGTDSSLTTRCPGLTCATPKRSAAVLGTNPDRPSCYHQRHLAPGPMEVGVTVGRVGLEPTAKGL